MKLQKKIEKEKKDGFSIFPALKLRKNIDMR
jgi:hypothetical protein